MILNHKLIAGFRGLVTTYGSSKANLSERASLTFISTFLLQATRFLVGFVVTPIVVRGLGAELYGAWRMMQQSVGYLSLTDLRPMGTLKFTLAVRQHIEDTDEKRRQVGSALRLWAITFPFFLVCGIIIIWQAPNFIKTAPQYVESIRIAMGILVISVALERVISLPANVLRGMNLAYKGMWLNILSVVLGGAATVLAIWFGFGLPGVAAAGVIGVVLGGGFNLYVVRKELHWFSATRPSKDEFLKFFKLSSWLFLSGISGILLNSSDIILVGYVLGPKTAAIYAATGLVLNMLTRPLMMLLGSATPGLAGLCGQENWQRVLRVREEILLLNFFGLTLIAIGVILLNNIFLTLWIEQGYYAGGLVNFLLVCTVVVRALSRVDINIVSGMLQLKLQALSSLISGLIVIILGWIMLIKWGMFGMAFSSLIGACVFWVCNFTIIQRRIELEFSKLFSPNIIRFSIISILFVLFSYLIAVFVPLEKFISINWVSFIGLSMLCLCISSCLLYILIGTDAKRMLIIRVRNLFV